jgi:hypothetical protein
MTDRVYWEKKATKLYHALRGLWFRGGQAPRQVRVSRMSYVW